MRSYPSTTTKLKQDISVISNYKIQSDKSEEASITTIKSGDCVQHTEEQDFT